MGATSVSSAASAKLPLGDVNSSVSVWTELALFWKLGNGGDAKVRMEVVTAKLCRQGVVSAVLSTGVRPGEVFLSDG
jgi:hypothetical protein